MATPVLSVSNNPVELGQVITFSLSVTNDLGTPMTSVTVTSLVPEGLQFVTGSVYINGTNQPTLNPNTGFSAVTIPLLGSLDVTYQAEVIDIPTVNPMSNMATINYMLLIVGYTIYSNTVNVTVNSPSLLAIKSSGSGVVVPGGIVEYQFSLGNTNTYANATQVTLSDTLSNQFQDSSIEYSTDGQAWNAWTGTIVLGDMQPHGTQTLYIRGTVKPDASGIIENQATVDIVFSV